MNERWFFNPSECQVVCVRAGGEVYDPDNGEVFADLTADAMSDSDDWFEYESDPRGDSNPAQFSNDEG